MADTLYFIIPCYKEEECLAETAARLLVKLERLVLDGKISDGSRIIFVNDGSTDNTWQIIQDLHENDNHFGGINLSRNRGHQNALLAGLMTVTEMADFTISMDADLQDDINAVDKMIDLYNQGRDIVYGVRNKREKDTFFKRFTALQFYKMLDMLGVQIVFNHADYRLMSRRALLGLAEYQEVNLFLRGLIPMIGYPSATVYYERGERFAGETKYPLRRMLALALEGITSLSIRPIRIISIVGFLSFLASLVMLIWFFIAWLAGGTVSGWASTIVSIWAIGGLQLLAIGIIGEYIGKIYLEVKARPRFIVEKVLIDKANTP